MTKLVPAASIGPPVSGRMTPASSATAIRGPCTVSRPDAASTGGRVGRIRIVAPSNAWLAQNRAGSPLRSRSASAASRIRPPDKLASNQSRDPGRTRAGHSASARDRPTSPSCASASTCQPLSAVRTSPDALSRSPSEPSTTRLPISARNGSSDRRRSAQAAGSSSGSGQQPRADRAGGRTAGTGRRSSAAAHRAPVRRAAPGRARSGCRPRPAPSPRRRRRGRDRAGSAAARPPPRSSRDRPRPAAGARRPRSQAAPSPRRSRRPGRCAPRSSPRAARRAG